MDDKMQKRVDTASASMLRMEKQIRAFELLVKEVTAARDEALRQRDDAREKARRWHGMHKRGDFFGSVLEAYDLDAADIETW